MQRRSGFCDGNRFAGRRRLEYALMKELNYDVVVIGVGCAGISASVAASRYCDNVLLAEKNGWLGGISTTVLVHRIKTK